MDVLQDVSALVADSIDQLGPLQMSQVELAAALNVSQPAVSQWVSGRRHPDGAVIDRLGRAWRALEFPVALLGVDARGRRVVGPAGRWEPVFAPAGRFRLPIHVEWSGTAGSRWRDPLNPQDVLGAYALLLEFGRVADIVCWVDPVVLGKFLFLVPLSSVRAKLWAKHLMSLEYEVPGGVV